MQQKYIKITGSEHNVRSGAVNSLYVAEAAPVESYVVVSFPAAVCLLGDWFQFIFAVGFWFLKLQFMKNGSCVTLLPAKLILRL